MLTKNKNVKKKEKVRRYSSVAEHWPRIPQPWVESQYRIH
jgi:glutaredoxin-related protein